jgi:hypothetical protein
MNRIRPTLDGEENGSTNNGGDHVLSVMKLMIGCILIRNRNVTSLKIYEIQGKRVYLNMTMSLGPQCVTRVENRAITDIPP